MLGFQDPDDPSWLYCADHAPTIESQFGLGVRRTPLPIAEHYVTPAVCDKDGRPLCRYVWYLSQPDAR